MKPKLCIVSLAILCLFACKKDDDTPGNFQTPLPSATQNGAGTFACYVNGKAFIDNDKQFNCYYQLINDKYYFNIKGSQDFQSFSSVSIKSSEIPIENNKTYKLEERKDNGIWGEILFYSKTKIGGEFTSTSKDNPGTLTITRFDKEKSIVSGTFSFTVTNPFTNEVINVTDGRFDSYFSN